MDKERDCKWADFCIKCQEPKEHYCQRCFWYRFLDSGYGHCFLLPEPLIVAWCKDPCSFYKEERR